MEEPDKPATVSEVVSELAAERGLVRRLTRALGFADFMRGGGADRARRCLGLTADYILAAKIIQMPCPVCKKYADASPANRYRPFCSERCQMIDLGRWAGENYRVPGGSADDREYPDDLPKKKPTR